jgi:hypothetical protein
MVQNWGNVTQPFETWLTPWTRDILEKLNRPSPTEEFPTFYELEGSLPYRDPAPVLDLEPDESSLVIPF